MEWERGRKGEGENCCESKAKAKKRNPKARMINRKLQSTNRKQYANYNLQISISVVSVAKKEVER
jgi:hypothetical protein